MPLVTVLMPIRDGAPFLDEAVGSILAQSFGDLELLAVDDGSCDATPGLLGCWAMRDRRLRVLTTPARGIVAALNAGLAQAAGTLIVRMDADDVALPQRIEALVSRARRSPEAAVIGSAYTVIDPAGRKLRDILLPTDADAIRTHLLHGNCIAHPTVLMRRGPVADAGGYRPAFPGCEDYDLWLRLAERHTLVNLPERLLLYQVASWPSDTPTPADAAACGGCSPPLSPRMQAGRAP